MIIFSRSLIASILLLPTWVSAATNLADIAPARGFKIVGAASGDGLGGGLAEIGDLNGDGRSDVAIGAPGADRIGAADVGAVYVIFGKANPAHPFDLGTLDGSNGFKLIDSTAAASSFAGAAVGPAGDVNNDSRADFWIANGAFLSAAPAYVVFGRASWPALLDLATLNGSNGFKIVPSAALATSGLGNAIAGGSDINGDGIDDLVFGAPNANTTSGQTLGGRAYVVLGRTAPVMPPGPTFPASFSPDTLGSGTILFEGLASDFLGFSVDMGADFNSDGRRDLMVSAIGSPENGKAYIVYGRTIGNPFNPVNSMPSTANFAVFGSVSGNGDGFGTPAKFLPDINGDGIADLGVAAPDHTFAGGPTSVGTLYVIYGATSLPASLNVGAMIISQGFHLDGTATQDDAAEIFSGPGDITGDGIGDLLVGVARSEVGATLNAGKLYVVDGVSGTRPLAVALADVDSGALPGEVFQSNTANAQFGLSGAAGLFDGDARRDFMVASPTEGTFGEVFLIHKNTAEFANGFEDP